MIPGEASQDEWQEGEQCGQEKRRKYALDQALCNSGSYGNTRTLEYDAKSMRVIQSRRTSANPLQPTVLTKSLSIEAPCGMGNTTYCTFVQRFEILLRVPTKATGNAHKKMRPAVANQDSTYRDCISRAPSSRFRQTISLGCASMVLFDIHCGYTQIGSDASHSPDIRKDSIYLMITQTLSQNMSTHLQVAPDECAAQEFPLHNMYSRLLDFLV